MINSVSILGSTGSIGTRALDVARFLNIRVYALAAGRNVELLYEQFMEFMPEIVSVADEDAARRFADMIVSRTPYGRDILGCFGLFWGDEGLKEAAVCPGADMVLVGVSGAAGLTPVVAAIKAQKTVALANKEALVMAGEIVMKLAWEYGARIIPVDSEHSAVFQCIAGNDRKCLKKIMLTASGGPFWQMPIEQFKYVTAGQAAKHPVWEMGKKITIDSATMMNKGLEVIEAAWLFNCGYENVEVLIHPQGIVHSMVHFRDNSVIAQLGLPDMRLPIQYAFSYPDKVDGLTGELDLTNIVPLEFHRPDFEKFRCLRLAYDAAAVGGTLPTVMNAANEVAVDLFLLRRIAFTQIPEIVERVMDRRKSLPAHSIEDIMAEDRAARVDAIETAMALIR